MTPDFDDQPTPPSSVRAPWEKASATPTRPDAPLSEPAVPVVEPVAEIPMDTPAPFVAPPADAPIGSRVADVERNVESEYENGKLLAEQLQTLGYHPVVVVGTAGSGKTALLLSLMGYLRGASKASNVQIVLGQPLLDQTTQYGQQIQEQAVGLFNQALQAFLSGVAPPATKATQPFFVPIELQFHDGKIQKYAFLESDGEWYRPDYNSPSLYKDLRPELEALFRHFKGSISMFYVAPATQMSFASAQARAPQGGNNATSMRDASQGLVGAMQHYSSHRAAKRRLDQQVFLITKWDSVFEPGASSHGFEEPRLEDAVAFARDNFSDAFAYFESMNVGDKASRKKILMQYSSGLMSNRVIASPDRSELRALHYYHRTLWNLLSRFGFGTAVDPEPVTPRSVGNSLRNMTDGLLGMLGMKPNKR